MPLARRMLVAAAAMLLLASCSGSGAPAAKTAPDGSPAGTGGRVIVTAAEAPWRLPAPLSRMVAVPDGSSVRVAGGLTASDASASAVYRLDVGSGAARQAGALSQPVHDAAGASIAGALFVFGGGAASTTAAVQRVDGTGAGRVVGRLPQPRSDLAAVTLGGQVYLLGGYTGARQLAEVLDTTDGTTFHPAASLPVPVRYPAVAAVGTTIWVFGGEQSAGPVRAIQRVDVTTGRARVVGQLPDALSQATALVLDGQVLLAGGRTSSTATSSSVYLFDPGQVSVHPVAQLPMSVADAGGVVVDQTGYLLGGENDGRVADVQTLTLATAPTSPTPSPSGGAAAGAGRLSDTHPVDGSLLIADHGTNRLPLVDADKRLL
jgi:N-acetylneuraminic acid mutarotase